MKRIRTYRGKVPAFKMALGLSDEGEIGVAVKQGESKEVFVFYFASDEQLDKFVQDVLELKYERDCLYEGDDTPVQRLIRER